MSERAVHCAWTWKNVVVDKFLWIMDLLNVFETIINYKTIIKCFVKKIDLKLCVLMFILWHTLIWLGFCFLQVEEPTSDGPNSSFQLQNFPARAFIKKLTPSDRSTHGGFSIPKKYAEEFLPPLVSTFWIISFIAKNNVCIYKLIESW